MGYHSVHDFSKETIRQQLSDPNREILDMAKGSDGNWYVAERLKNLDVVTATVVVRRKSGAETFINFVSEFAGPGATSCPRKILDLLTPTADIDIKLQEFHGKTREGRETSGYADVWRERCLWELNNIEQSSQLKPGDVVKFSTSYGGCSVWKVQSIVTDAGKKPKPKDFMFIPSEHEPDKDALREMQKKCLPYGGTNLKLWSRFVEQVYPGGVMEPQQSEEQETPKAVAQFNM